MQPEAGEAAKIACNNIFVNAARNQGFTYSPLAWHQKR